MHDTKKAPDEGAFIVLDLLVPFFNFTLIAFTYCLPNSLHSQLSSCKVVENIIILVSTMWTNIAVTMSA